MQYHGDMGMERKMFTINEFLKYKSNKPNIYSSGAALQKDVLAVSTTSKYKINVIIFSRHLDCTFQNVKTFMYLS